jgi:hypothetical protein
MPVSWDNGCTTDAYYYHCKLVLETAGRFLILSHPIPGVPWDGGNARPKLGLPVASTDESLNRGMTLTETSAVPRLRGN